MENGPFIDVLPIKMVIFNSYVNLPEGKDPDLYGGSIMIDPFADELINHSDLHQLEIRNPKNHPPKKWPDLHNLRFPKRNGSKWPST